MKKKSSGKRKATKTVVRKIYVTNPAPKKRKKYRRTNKTVASSAGRSLRYRRPYKRNPGVPAWLQTFMSAVFGAIAVPFAASKIPNATSNLKNGVMLGLSLASLYFIRKRPNPLALGVSIGAGVIGGSRLLTNKYPQLAGEAITEDVADALAGYINEVDPELLGAPASFEDAEIMGAPAFPMSGMAPEFNSSMGYSGVL